MADLSPAAQAVLDAHDNAPFENFVAADRLAVAAALRTAALHCKRDNLILLAIADELEELDKDV